MDRLHRQRVVSEWDQRYLTEASIFINAPNEAHQTLIDAFIRGCILIGIGQIHLIGHGWDMQVDDLRGFGNSLQARTTINYECGKTHSTLTRQQDSSNNNQSFIVHFNPDDDSRLGERFDSTIPQIKGLTLAEKVVWSLSNGQTLSSERLPQESGCLLNPSLDVFLAGTVLAEVVRNIMPLQQWNHSEIMAPISFPNFTLPIKREIDPTNDQKTIAIIGGGALGNWFLYALCKDELLLDVSNIIIVDDDVVDITNLNRQVLFTSEDIGKSKAETLASKLTFLLPGIKVQALNERVQEDDFFIKKGIIPDIIISCVDSWATRALLNRIALAQNIPLVNGGTDPWSCNVYAFEPCVSVCLNCAIGVEAKSKQTNSRTASCALVEPSVVFTNMIAAGLVLWMLHHSGCGRQGVLHYDITIPERMGFLQIPDMRRPCHCKKFE